MARSTEAPLGSCNTLDPNLGALFLMPTQQRNPPHPRNSTQWVGEPQGWGKGRRGHGTHVYIYKPDPQSWTEG